SQPTKDIDVYLQPLIKELQELWKGVWTKDAATGTYFEMKAALLWTINDFPARSSLSAFFDIMIHVAIHLPDEAILGGPLRYRWSIAEGYVSEEALTFCSRYLKDDVETRFNRLGRNDDGLLEEEPDKFQQYRVFPGRYVPTRLEMENRETIDD
ncbi:hypothetical protein Tco_1363840, partial [Tanacetum coccineum]